MYHALALEDLLLCGFSGPAAGDVRDGLSCRAAAMLAALRTVTHPDGEIALFNDSALGIASSPAALLALADGLGAPLGHGSQARARDSGGAVPARCFRRRPLQFRAHL